MPGETQEPSQEPSVLDWFRSLLRLKPIPIPEEDAAPWISELPSVRQPHEAIRARTAIRVRWAHLRLPMAFLLALIAQVRLELRSYPVGLSIAFYVIAAGLAGWAIWAGDLTVGRPRQHEGVKAGAIQVRLLYLAAAAVFGLLTWFTSQGNRFRLSTVLFWVAAIVYIVLALWEGDISLKGMWRRIKRWYEEHRKIVRISTWSFLVLAAFGLAAYFRFTQLSTVPLEMWSDHAEKLSDVTELLNGETRIFFPSNTGREAFQFYLAAATIKLLNTGISFLTLKIGTVLAGLLTLPYLYLFAKEFGGRKVALVALLLAGVAYWPNTISRFGLRFPLYSLFAAPAMYHLIRGLRLKQRNHFLICGLFTGFGLHGYSPARAIPVAIVVGVAIFLLHRTSRGQRREVLGWLVACGLVALVVFLPLLRVAVEMPDAFMYRTLTRISNLERELPEPALKTFVSNVLKGLAMFGWDNGEIWVITLTHRPELDWITAALFHLGVVVTLVRYIRKRNWQDVFILVSILVLMLPSTLSLAFPNENPAPNRSIGAIIPVFTLAAIPLAAIPEWAKQHWRDRRVHLLGYFAAASLFVFALSNNYYLTFKEFPDHARQGLWNTSEAGQVVHAFAETVGSYATTHVIPYPYWMDTTLVGIAAGQGVKNFAYWSDQLEALAAEARPQLFLLHPNDIESLQKLEMIFPEGSVKRWEAEIEGKDFLMYSVPARPFDLEEPQP
ncbi:MAG TPA: glycosyltransferase family 39 protein [Anaerolineae bacterium]|nr:glycosyltransferase family 39 protein [Anaerolineae bacterium]